MWQALHLSEGSDIYCGGFRAAAGRRAGIIRYRNKKPFICAQSLRRQNLR